MKLLVMGPILRVALPVIFISVLSLAVPVNKGAITKDLQAMKRSGYTGALIFNVGVGIPMGEVEYASDELFQLLKHTFNEASKYDLEISMHNSPRFEVGLNETARNSSSIALKEPLRKLDYYKDVAVLAYPSLPAENRAVFRDAIDTIAINGTEVAPDATQGIRLDKTLRVESSAATVDITMKSLFTASAINIFRFPEIH